MVDEFDFPDFELEVLCLLDKRIIVKVNLHGCTSYEELQSRIRIAVERAKEHLMMKIE